MKSAVRIATEDPVVGAAQLAFSGRLKGSADVSAHTKNALCL